MTKREYRGILAGMVLGDGNLQLRDNYVNPVLRINHSAKQREYLKHKIALLQPMFAYDLMKSYREKEIENTQTGKRYKICTLHTRVSSKLKFLFKTFYPGGKKQITRRGLNLLTPQGIALWYMDDGNYSFKRRTVMLSTYTSREENEVMKKFFEEKYNIHWTIGKHYEKFFLHRGAKTEDMKRFMKLISPFVIPQMKYKLIFTAATPHYEE